MVRSCEAILHNLPCWNNAHVTFPPQLVFDIDSPRSPPTHFSQLRILMLPCGECIFDLFVLLSLLLFYPLLCLGVMNSAQEFGMNEKPI